VSDKKPDYNKLSDQVAKDNAARGVEIDADGRQPLTKGLVTGREVYPKK
jgi:hypothetical protein